MRKGWMNSYAKFGGAARRHFSAISEKPMGGHICAPPAVRGLKAKQIHINITLFYEILLDSGMIKTYPH